MALSLLELTGKAMEVHGRISHDAAFADTLQYELFYHLAGTTREVARAIYFTLDSSKGKASLVKRVAEAKGMSGTVVACLKTLAEAIQAITKFRNSTAHAFLLLRRDGLKLDGHLRVVNPKASTQPAPKATETTLKNAEMKSAKLLLDVGRAFEAACQAIGVPATVTLLTEV